MTVELGAPADPTLLQLFADLATTSTIQVCAFSSSSFFLILISFSPLGGTCDNGLCCGAGEYACVGAYGAECYGAYANCQCYNGKLNCDYEDAGKPEETKDSSIWRTTA